VEEAACDGGRTMVVRTSFARYGSSTQRSLISFLNSVHLLPLALKIKHTYLTAKCTLTTAQSKHMASFKASSHVREAEQIMRSLT